MAYLIDTDILIFSLRGNPSVQSNFKKNESIPKALSIISFGELLVGAKKSVKPETNLALVYRLRVLFPIIQIDVPIMELFSDLKVRMQANGRIIDDMDLLIASTAMTLNYTLVTNNSKHFSKVNGLKLENWLLD